LYRSRPGATIAQIAADLGINPETLRSWIRIDDGKTVGAHGPKKPGPPAASNVGGLESEVAALRRKARELEEAREILRKAAKHFAGETRW
jgi:transposase